jgi:hypothetical protein
LSFLNKRKEGRKKGRKETIFLLLLLHHLIPKFPKTTSSGHSQQTSK